MCILINSGEASRNGAQLGQFAAQQATILSTLDRVDEVTSKFSADLVALIGKVSSSGQRNLELVNFIDYALSDKCGLQQLSRRRYRRQRT